MVKIIEKTQEKNCDYEKDFNPEFMKRAIALSRQASIIEKSGGVFGAVIVKDGKIIAEGYNQVIRHNDPTWHAEMQTIREACKKMGSPHLKGCILYTSAECCPMCLAASYWAHLDHIFYGARVEDSLEYGDFQDVDILEELRKDPNILLRISFFYLIFPLFPLFSSPCLCAFASLR